jgi:hypothetical protein
MLEGRNEKGDLVHIHQAFTAAGQSIIVMTAIIGERDYPHSGGWAGPVESIAAGKKEADHLFKGLVWKEVPEKRRDLPPQPNPAGIIYL